MYWALLVRLCFWFKNDLGQKYHASEVQLNRGSKSRPSDYDSTFHVTEMPALSTWPSATLSALCFICNEDIIKCDASSFQDSPDCSPP